MRGAENRADAPGKRERRPRERTGEKKYDFRLCAQLIFCAQLTANDALKHKILLVVWKTQKTHKKQGSTKIRREHVHVKNDASTSMHFYVHPYTRERISHTRDCNVIALNASHNIHLHIVSHILSAYFLGRGFVCMFVCRKTDALTDAR